MGNGCKCQRCGRRYKVDFMVPDMIWERIKPEGKPKGAAGLLCGVCIAQAIENFDQYDAFSVERVS